MVAFYRLRRGERAVTSGLQFESAPVQRREERGSGWLPRTEEHHKEPQASQDNLWWSGKVGKPEGDRLPLPRSSGQVWARKKKGRRRASGGSAGFLGQVTFPGTAWQVAPLADSKMLRFCPYGV
jgi:hypothetical protein